MHSSKTNHSPFSPTKEGSSRWCTTTGSTIGCFSLKIFQNNFSFSCDSNARWECNGLAKLLETIDIKMQLDIRAANVNRNIFESRILKHLEIKSIIQYLPYKDFVLQQPFFLYCSLTLYYFLQKSYNFYKLTD